MGVQGHLVGPCRFIFSLSLFVVRAHSARRRYSMHTRTAAPTIVFHRRTYNSVASLISTMFNASGTPQIYIYIYRSVFCSFWLGCFDSIVFSPFAHDRGSRLRTDCTVLTMAVICWVAGLTMSIR